MDIEFDPAKDALNIAKHEISLARVIDLEGIVVVPDDRFSEPRLRLYGTIDGNAYCAAAVLRNGNFRVINLRRAHKKEYRRHVGR